MPRAAATADVFTAIAEPRRRQIIALLASGRAHSVNDIVERLAVNQPAVSKHLAVLRAVGVLSVERQGKTRLYSLTPAKLKSVHDWAKQFERFWSNQLGRIKTRAEQKARDIAANN